MLLKDFSFRVLLLCPSSKTNIKFQVILPIEMTQNGTVSYPYKSTKIQSHAAFGGSSAFCKIPLTLDLA